MLAILRRFTILQRLILMLVLAAIGTFVFASFSINEQRNNLIKQKWLQNDAQLSTLLSVIDTHYRQSQQNILTPEDAQREAANLVNQIQYGESGYFLLFDADHTLLANGASPDQLGIKASKLTSQMGGNALDKLLDKAMASGIAKASMEMRNPITGEQEEALMEARTFPAWQWTLVTTSYMSDVNDTTISVMYNYLGIMLLISVPIFAFFLILNHSISSPLNQAIDAMKDIAEGEGDLTKRLPTQGKDEVVALAIA